MSWIFLGTIHWIGMMVAETVMMTIGVAQDPCRRVELLNEIFSLKHHYFYLKITIT